MFTNALFLASSDQSLVCMIECTPFSDGGWHESAALRVPHSSGNVKVALAANPELSPCPATRTTLPGALSRTPVVRFESSMGK